MGQAALLVPTDGLLRREEQGHGEVGEASLIATERDYLKAVQQRVAELKSQGKSADESAKLLTVEFRAKYPTWENPGWITDAVERFYSEAN